MGILVRICQEKIESFLHVNTTIQITEYGQHDEKALRSCAQDGAG